MCVYWRRCVGVVIFNLAVSVTMASSDDPLTVAEAQRLAVQQSEKLAVSKYERNAAEELRPAADQLPDPVLRMGFDNVPVDGADRFTLNNDFMTMSRVGVMQEFTRGDKRRLRAERADLSIAMAEAQHEMTLATVQRETALRWFAGYYSQRQLDLINEQLNNAQAAAVAANAAYAQGKSGSADALAAHATVVQVQDQADEAAYRLRAARIALSRWIGDAANRPWHAPPNIDVLPLHAHHDAAQLESQLREHPDIVMLDRRLDVAQADAQLARADRKSDWSVELSYARRGPMYADMLSLGVSVPLQFNRDHRQNRELASKLALASAAKAERDDMYRAHLAEVRTMLDEWNTTRVRHTRYQQELLPLAQDRVVAAEAAYRGGKQNLESVIAAQSNRIDMARQTLRLESEIARLWAELSFLTVAKDTAAGVEP